VHKGGPKIAFKCILVCNEFRRLINVNFRDIGRIDIFVEFAAHFTNSHELSCVNLFYA